MSKKLNLYVLGIYDSPVCREQFLEHIPEMFNLKLEKSVTGKELIEALNSKFENLHHNHKPEDYLASIKDWNEYNASEVEGWDDMVVIPLAEDEERQFLALTFYVEE